MRPTTLRFISHGLKNGPLPKADLYLDCRVIVNPFLEGGLFINHAALVVWMKQNNQPTIDVFIKLILQGLSTLSPRRRSPDEDPHRPMIICLFCAYGQHRSVAMKQLLADAFRAPGHYIVEEV